MTIKASGPLLKFRILLCIAYVMLMIFVKPVTVGGDASMYADDVERSLPHGWGETHDIWNFAHVIWRPTGRLLSELFMNGLLPHFGGNPTMTIAFLMMLPNLMTGLLCGLILQTMIWKLTGSAWASFLATFAFFCLNPLLHYTRLGSPYIVGITCSTAAMYLVCMHPPRRWWTAVLAGALSGLAVLCWAPFLVSFPAVLASMWIFGESQDDGGVPRIRYAIAACAAAGAITVAFYALAMGVAGIHGVSGLMSWIHESAPAPAGSRALRMISGMSRGFYDLGDDATWLKWFRFHDPYAKVGIVDLIRGPLFKVALFYFTLLGLVVLLWKSALRNKMLLFVAIAVLPHLAVALAYESGSVERYVAFLPALFLSFGYLMGTATSSSARKVAAAVLCFVHVPFNLASASDRNLGNVLQREPDRLAVMLSISPESRIFVINGYDPLIRLSYGDPLNPLHKQRLGSVNTFPAFARPIQFWNIDFACSAIYVEDHGGEVWVTKRFLSPEPRRDWLWAEGDIPGLSWEMMHRYFSSFDTRVQRGGDDGFFKVTATGQTRQRLLSEIEASGQTCVGR